MLLLIDHARSILADVDRFSMFQLASFNWQNAFINCLVFVRKSRTIPNLESVSTPNIRSNASLAIFFGSSSTISGSIMYRLLLEYSKKVKLTSPHPLVRKLPLTYAKTWAPA
jgi:hypothetical protein